MLNNLALLYKRQGKVVDAESYYQVAIEQFERGQATQSVAMASALFNLGKLYQDENRFEEAANQYARALPLFESARGAGDPATRLLRSNYAATLRSLGRDAEAAALETPDA